MKQREEKQQIDTVLRFMNKPKVGSKVMVFMGGDVYPDHWRYEKSRYGIVREVVEERACGRFKYQESINLVECGYIDTFEVDYFIDSKRVNFVGVPEIEVK